MLRWHDFVNHSSSKTPPRDLCLRARQESRGNGLQSDTDVLYEEVRSLHGRSYKIEYRLR